MRAFPRRLVSTTIPSLTWRRQYALSAHGKSRLENKRIIVTGGANGVAEATVRAFAREGASVISLDIQDDKGKAVAKSATEAGPGKVTYMHCDITKQDDVNLAFEEAVAQLGGLDALAAIAGTEAIKAAEDLTGPDVDAMINVHLKHTVFTQHRGISKHEAEWWRLYHQLWVPCGYLSTLPQAGCIRRC